MQFSQKCDILKNTFWSSKRQPQVLEKWNLTKLYLSIISKNYFFAFFNFLFFFLFFWPTWWNFRQVGQKWEKRINTDKWGNNLLDIIERYNLTKFHVSFTSSCLLLLQNVFLRKLHFCENAHFLTWIGQNFWIFDFSWFYNYFLLII